jgi:O-acetyl-ADP-ribose deacetylase (regulator of RNase III)
MGKGLALAFKQRYPAMFAVYQQECKTGKLRIGRPTLYQDSTPWILNFPTKDHWRFPSKLEYLEKGLEFLIANYKKAGITSIAFPKLGAQNGKLSWDEVGPLMAKYLSQIDIDVYIYIAEEDKEYQAEENAAYQNDIESDNRLNEKIWAQFNELALSIDRLQQEVDLSRRQAKMVASKRAEMEFKSLADIKNIEGIAPTTSLRSIRKYIDNQKYGVDQLLHLSGSGSQKLTKVSTNATKRNRRKSVTSTADPKETLFQDIELVGQSRTKH